ncbi:hypothetical protein ASPVEDRAFT_666073 [Aspergillus versicolor CBS 583.65]|uniref:Uncharacterized protein n=1 Tax=Aspergillus versicolor CBS 583.65 TaxID=1036611 RepID=A0A1L9PL67_ASPVE|nr:uncharacterized protein ASPVEDRAFT_666073 [Aspergillus versicolor CBS 583.65]OJJ02279.1 hypothetical protein ASPVEDRAFT_666073 [Aspergillus versicolor CBS 583.65]
MCIVTPELPAQGLMTMHCTFESSMVKHPPSAIADRRLLHYTRFPHALNQPVGADSQCVYTVHGKRTYTEFWSGIEGYGSISSVADCRSPCWPGQDFSFPPSLSPFGSLVNGRLPVSSRNAAFPFCDTSIGPGEINISACSCLAAPPGSGGIPPQTMANWDGKIVTPVLVTPFLSKKYLRRNGDSRFFLVNLVSSDVQIPIRIHLPISSKPFACWWKSPGLIS